MTIFELLAQLLEQYGVTIGVCAVVALSLVEIAPIKINPWSKILGAIGKGLNKDTITELESLKKEVQKIDDRVDKIDARIDENNAVQCRSRILRFGDEVSHGTNHSRDHFRQIFSDITSYNTYCHNHPDFQNDMTKITSKIIEDDYVDRDKNDNFL